MLRPRHVRHRMALTHALALAFGLVVYSATLYFLYQRNLFQDLDVRVRNDLEAADDRLDVLLKPEGDGSTLDPENWLTELWTNDHRRVYTSGNDASFPLGPYDAACARRTSPQTVASDNGFAVRVFCQASSSHRGQYELRVARLAENIEGQLHDFRILMLLGAPLIVVLSGALGSWLAGRALAPIARMTSHARTITVNRLGERLTSENPDDELGQLSEAFNAAFKGLERSFVQMRRFSADASHELRTPLTAIRTMGEIALRARDKHHDPYETIGSILEEAERLQRLCENLLILARSDAGQHPVNIEQADLARLVRGVTTMLEILAEEKSQTIQLQIQEPFAGSCDVVLMKQAVANLLDNAIKYSPDGTTIAVRANSGPAGVMISVTDQGPGIAPEHQELVFDRFYRIDPSRARGTGGTGLGLAITKWIAELHGGQVTLISVLGKGSEFQIAIPHHVTTKGET